MRAMLGEKADLAVGSPESDEILSHEAQANRRTSGFKLARQERCGPITPQQLAHRAARPGLGHELVIFELHQNAFINL